MADGAAITLAAVTPPPRSLPVHPTQIYSAITAALLAWVLWSFYPLRRRDGEVTALMITLYPIARFLLEMIRVDEPSVFGTGLSISQNISVGLLAIALGLWIWLIKRPRQLAFSSTAPG
jgi:phosphatidylglycerol:prolipoprotein diacylglycerol transferase